jgi:hypothetical protein
MRSYILTVYGYVPEETWTSYRKAVRCQIPISPKETAVPKASPLALTAFVLLASCSAGSTSPAPDARVMLPDGKPVGMFRDDHLVCKALANREIDGGAEAYLRCMASRGNLVSEYHRASSDRHG